MEVLEHQKSFLWKAEDSEKEGRFNPLLRLSFLPGSLHTILGSFIAAGQPR